MLKNEIGNRFGRLFVTSRAVNLKDGTARWVCMCDCGKSVTNTGVALRSGVIVSCGCYMRETKIKHMRCFTPEYKSWQGMKERCHNPQSKDFARYGGRGVHVCDKWRDSFEAFYNDMGPRVRGLSIERIDNNGHYSPDNCAWATVKEQSNNRRSSHFITFNGETRTVSQWAKLIGITHAAIQKRLKKSKDIAYALSPKMDRRGNRL